MWVIPSSVRLWEELKNMEQKCREGNDQIKENHISGTCNIIGGKFKGYRPFR
jgi:hypothetical protein